MAMMFGRFEIQSELSKSDTALIYKATDTETNQTVALKTQNLESLGDRVSAFVDTLIAEGESTRGIAERLSYSERTVKNIVHDLLVTLKCKTRAHAVALAAREGMI